MYWTAFRDPEFAAPVSPAMPVIDDGASAAAFYGFVTAWLRGLAHIHLHLLLLVLGGG